jgi:serine/threonine protein kinase
MVLANCVRQYRILSRLGSGAGTEVYEACSRDTGEMIALKYVRLREESDRRFLEEMRAEHECGSTLEHPAIRRTHRLRCLRQGLRIKAAVLYMEHVRGTELSAVAKSCTLPSLMRIMEKVAVGLHALHSGGFVHADVKPQNILVLPDGAVKLIDFGQSVRMHTVKERIQGTADYIAPEQVELRPLDARTDVFAFGAALHRILTGKPVTTELNRKLHLNGKGSTHVRMVHHRPLLTEMPPSVAKLIDDCCETDPDARPSDMLEVQRRCATIRTILAHRRRSG